MKSSGSPKLCFRIGIMIAVVFILIPARGFSQEPQPSPSSVETQLTETIKILQKQKEIVELERDIAKARADRLSAAPKPTSTPVKSDLTVTGVEIEPEIVVFAELDKANAKIEEAIRNSISSDSTLIIFDQRDFDDWKFYRESFPLFKVILEDLTESFCIASRMSGEKSTGLKSTVLDLSSALAGGSNLVGQFADLLSYFRTETKSEGREIDIDESIIASDLFGKLSRKGSFKLYDPTIFPPEISLFCGRSNVKNPCCVANSADCSEQRNIYCSETANLFDAVYRARKTAFELNPASPELKKLDKDLDDFNKLFAEKTAGAERTSMERYLNSERLSKLMIPENVYFLKIESIKSVGSRRLRKNLFFLTDRLDYSGGIILGWTLFEKSGAVVNGGVVNSYDGYRTPKQLRNNKSGKRNL